MANLETSISLLNIQVLEIFFIFYSQSLSNQFVTLTIWIKCKHVILIAWTYLLNMDKIQKSVESKTIMLICDAHVDSSTPCFSCIFFTFCMKSENHSCSLYSPNVLRTYYTENNAGIPNCILIGEGPIKSSCSCWHLGLQIIAKIWLCFPAIVLEQESFSSSDCTHARSFMHFYGS